MIDGSEGIKIEAVKDEDNLIIEGPKWGHVLQVSKEGGVYLDKETKDQLDRIEALLLKLVENENGQR